MHSHVGYVATPQHTLSTEGRARVGMQVSGFERFVPQTELDTEVVDFFSWHTLVPSCTLSPHRVNTQCTAGKSLELFFQVTPGFFSHSLQTETRTVNKTIFTFFCFNSSGLVPTFKQRLCCICNSIQSVILFLPIFICTSFLSLRY